jgi:hypothetical protein
MWIRAIMGSVAKNPNIEVTLCFHIKDHKKAECLLITCRFRQQFQITGL